MGAATLDDAKRAWAACYEGLRHEEVDQRVAGFVALVQGIAEHGAVSPAEFASKLGVESLQAKELFSDLATVGVQLDEAGNVVGAALTTRKTPHRIQVNGRELYAWCALDTLFIPGLLGETADIESTCPSTGEAIRLRVSPERIEACEPAGAWLSVFLPGGSTRQTGPASPT